MEYREDKRSGRQLSALGFGCMRLPKELPSELLILRAIELGINYFDTAYLYPGNEEMLGHIIERNKIRNRMIIATKLPHSRCKSLADVDRFFDESLKHLGIDCVDNYLIHNMVELREWNRLVDLGICEWIERRRAAGQIKSIGFSFHGSQPEFMALLDAYPWDFCQIQYNYANENFQAGRAGLEAAAARSISVIIMEPLLGGRLVNSLPKKAQAALRAADPDASFASWGLKWLWDQPAVTCVLSGMNDITQLEDNAAVASATKPNSLTSVERAAIDAARACFEESFRIPCTGCNYCMPCPKGINIPAAFASYNTSYLMGFFEGVKGHLMSAGVAGSQPRFLADCIECGKCAKACPQHIDIPEQLKRVRGRVEPAPARGAIRVFSKFMK